MYEVRTEQELLDEQLIPHFKKLKGMIYIA